MNILYPFAAPGGLFILTLVFGFWVSRLGKPYNGVLFNVHKLIALGALVVTAIQMVNLAFSGLVVDQNMKGTQVMACDRDLITTEQA